MECYVLLVIHSLMMLGCSFCAACVLITLFDCVVYAILTPPNYPTLFRTKPWPMLVKWACVASIAWFMGRFVYPHFVYPTLGHCFNESPERERDFELTFLLAMCCFVISPAIERVPYLIVCFFWPNATE